MARLGFGTGSTTGEPEVSDSPGSDCAACSTGEESGTLGDDSFASLDLVAGFHQHDGIWRHEDLSS